MLTRALLCVAGALLMSAAPAHATFPGHNGKIVFTHFPDPEDESQSDIYTVSPNGRHLRNLTPGSSAADDFASWSADGRMIAFWSTRTDPDDNPTGDQAGPPSSTLLYVTCRSPVPLAFITKISWSARPRAGSMGLPGPIRVLQKAIMRPSALQRGKSSLASELGVRLTRWRPFGLMV